MKAIEEGIKCIITSGRRVGQEVEVTKLLVGNFVMVKGKKERKMCIKHLRPVEKK